MIDFQIGQQYYGFYLKEHSNIDDIHSKGYLFEHIQSGAKLFYINNKDDNKVFFIAFKTPPEDNCGVPHILEHSVLCGSKKYQAKDPFNELAKSSLNTYLNALTYADKTMYPIASRNQKDFMNMMDVYLDAVFFPRIYENKEIFMQEGWHYVLENKKAPLTIKGIVYNEMKGTLSDPETILNNAISRSLFPKTTYRFESGGNPEDIPNLTYENFLNFHRKYYHPSNSYIYLYGDMKIEEQLKWIDKEYLSKFQRKNFDLQISLEEDFSDIVFLEDTFSVNNKEDNIRNTFLSYNVRIGKSTNPTLIFAWDMLSYILLETNASPLKKALINASIAEETECWFDSSSYDMVFSIIAKKSEKENVLVFQNIIEKTLNDIVKNGIDKKLIEATLNRWEFYLKEEYFGSRPKGLTYGIKLMKSWLHGKSPMESLCYWKQFQEVKSLALTTNYFENLIETLILQNVNKSIVVVSPENGKQSRIEHKFMEEMKKVKSSLSENQIKQLIFENKLLKLYQSEPDSKEITNQIPFLNVSDINKNAEIFSTQKIQEEYQMIFTPLNTNGVVYSQLLFNTSFVPENLLHYASLLVYIMGKLDTVQYSFEQLPLEINFFTGGISLSNDIYSTSKQDYNSFITVNGKFLKKNIGKAFNIMKSILFETDFNQSENLKKLIKFAKVNLENYLQNAPHLAGISRNMGHIAMGARMKEEVSGVAFYHFLIQAEKEAEKDIEMLISKLKKVYSYIFTRQNIIVAVTCEESNLHYYKQEVKKLYNILLDKPLLKKQNYQFLLRNKQEGLISPFKIQYNIQSGNLLDYGYTYSGNLAVLKTILDLEYLWNTVRVQGGAYGCYCRFLKNGNAYFYSYRDPNIQKTYDIYEKASIFLEEFCDKNIDLTKYILGAINALDKPLGNEEKSNLAVARYLTGITPEIQQKERDEILTTTIKDIQKYILLLDKIMNQKNICTIGNDAVICKNKELFSDILPYI
ncbi:insulinase family protein [Lachnospiraceae bacterium 46-61]